MKNFNEHKNIEYTVTGIKCDSCTWHDYSFTWDDLDVIEKEWLNKPCPDCGENLLTQEDFDEVVNMDDAVNITNMYTEDELLKMVKNLSTDDMDKVLDVMNKFKKTGEDENGLTTWDEK